jgi:hypothetical protein
VKRFHFAHDAPKYFFTTAKTRDKVPGREEIRRIRRQLFICAIEQNKKAVKGLEGKFKFNFLGTQSLDVVVSFMNP